MTNTKVNKIAYIVPARLGDAVMTTPIVKLLKSYNPESQIDILAATKLAANVYKNNPHINNVYSDEDSLDWQTLKNQYDNTFITHTDRKTWAIAQKLKTNVFCDHNVDHSILQAEKGLNFIHSTYDNGLTNTAIDYQLFSSAADQLHIEQLLKNEIDSKQPLLLIGCHLGCHGISKKNRLRRLFKKKHHHKVWPLHHFRKLEKLLQKTNPQIRLVLTGSPSEINLSKKFIKNSNAINLVGKTSPLQLAALMSHLTAFISSDTGPMHVACATETPLIALFGPTNASRTGPYPKTSFRKVLQANKMSDIKPQQVYETLAELTEDIK